MTDRPHSCLSLQEWAEATAAFSQFEHTQVSDYRAAMAVFWPRTHERQELIEEQGAKCLPGLQMAVTAAFDHSRRDPAMQQFLATLGLERHPMSAASPSGSSAEANGYFFAHLLPFVVAQAKAFNAHFTDNALPLLDQLPAPEPTSESDPDAPAGARLVTRSFAMKRGAALSTLALALLGFEPHAGARVGRGPNAIGNMSFNRLLWTTVVPCGRERLVCLLLYFAHWHRLSVSDAALFAAQSDEELTFTRTAAAQTVSWADFDTLPLLRPPSGQEAAQMPPVAAADFARSAVVVDPRYIEQFPGAQSHVDFANKRIQIHQNIPSCTQEEVMFTVRPELYVCLAVYSTLRPHEAATVRGPRTFSRYTGYLDSFQCAGVEPAPFEEPLRTVPEVVVIDAHVNAGQQFGNAMHSRDCTKALVGFGSTTPERLVVGTGPWGCGVFAGDFYLKFMQQLMAAAVCESVVINGAPSAGARRWLYYHDGSESRRATLAAIAVVLQHCGATVRLADQLVSEFQVVPPSFDDTKGRAAAAAAKLSKANRVASVAPRLVGTVEEECETASVSRFPRLPFAAFLCMRLLEILSSSVEA